MRQNHFTLIELLVMPTIMWIITSTGIIPGHWMAKYWVQNNFVITAFCRAVCRLPGLLCHAVFTENLIWSRNSISAIRINSVQREPRYSAHTQLCKAGTVFSASVTVAANGVHWMRSASNRLTLPTIRYACCQNVWG